MADQIAVMNQGTLQQLGTPSEIYDLPANNFVARFVGSTPVNFIPGTLQTENGHTVHKSDQFVIPVSAEMADRAAELCPGGQCTLGVRPEEIRFTLDDEGGNQARVFLLEPLGSETILDIEKEGLPAQSQGRGRDAGARGGYAQPLLQSLSSLRRHHRRSDPLNRFQPKYQAIATATTNPPVCALRNTQHAIGYAVKSCLTLLSGNAPVSWGVTSAQAERGANLDYRRVMDEIAAAGLRGHRAWPGRLLSAGRGAAARRTGAAQAPIGLLLCPPAARARGRARNHSGHGRARRRAAARIRRQGDHHRRQHVARPPWRSPVRWQTAAATAWSDEEWQQAANALTAAARLCRDQCGLRVAFHHHAGTFVETPAEVARLMAMTDPELVGLCFDTGHYLYGGGDVLDAARQYADRIWYVHLKDVWAEKLARRAAGTHPHAPGVGDGRVRRVGAGLHRLPRLCRHSARSRLSGLADRRAGRGAASRP